MDLEQIARVFPRKTNASPMDALAFFGQPTIENIADCIKAGVTEVHISVTFTRDLEKAEDLYYAWQILGVPVEVGGPAFDDRMGDFTPGLYLREGMIFTSRGCTKDCWFCSVPRCKARLRRAGAPRRTESTGTCGCGQGDGACIEGCRSDATWRTAPRG